MSDIPRKPKFELIRPGDSDARRRLQADLVLADPSLTLDMITQDIADGLLDGEIREYGGISAVGVELLPDLCERIIDRIIARFATGAAGEDFDEQAARERLQELFDTSLKNYQ